MSFLSRFHHQPVFLDKHGMENKDPSAWASCVETQNVHSRTRTRSVIRSNMARVISNEVLETFLKQELQTNQLEYTGHFGGGCINEGQSFKTDSGVVFVKTNKKDGVSCCLQLL